jgi:hypothetical protein
LEHNTDSFVVHIWYETAGKDEKTVVCRGSIEHVGSKQRMYFWDLDCITRFIQQVTVFHGIKPLSGWVKMKHRLRGGYEKFKGRFSR